MGSFSQALPFERGTQRPPAGWELERKFLLGTPRVSEVLARLEGRTVVEVHDPARPIAWNRTTYFDTKDFAFLRSSCNGGVARKLRVREYASSRSETERPTLTGVCFLELKESGGGLRTKTRVKLEPWLLAALLGGRRLGGRNGVSAALLTFGSLLEKERPFPRLTSWYRRITRASVDRSVRITVDSQLVFAEPITAGGDEVEPESPIAREPFSIVEVKSAGAVPDWLDEVLGSLDEVDDFSKFRRGMSHLYPGVK